MIGRRGFLTQSSALLLCAGYAGACKPHSTRQSVVEELVASVLVPDVRGLKAPSNQLANALSRLAQEPQTLPAAQRAFVAALFAWQRVYAFRVGPVVESNALFRSTFWPPRATSMERVLTGTEPVDGALIEQLGVDAKGLFALELMLFGKPSTVEHVYFQGARAQRDGAFAAALGRDLQQRAHAANTLLGDGKTFATRFASAQPDGVFQLVNLLVETSETLAVDRLGYARTLHEQRRLVPGAVPGGLSGVSADILITWLTVMQRIYLGAHNDGLSLLVQQVAPATDQRARATFQAALQDVRALAGALESSVSKSPALAEKAAQSTRALEVLLKTELASALGVTISIVSGDGD